MLDLDHLLSNDTDLLLSGLLITSGAVFDSFFVSLLLLGDSVDCRNDLVHKLCFILVRPQFVNLESSEKLEELFGEASIAQANLELAHYLVNNLMKVVWFALPVTI